MRSTIFALTAALAVTVTACGNRSPVAYGEANSIIVVAPDSLWSAVGDTVHSIMEPRFFTVRDERTFALTHVSPADPDWAQLQEWKQILVIGRQDDPWIAPVLAGRRESLPPLPALVEKTDIWARGQTVTALVLPDHDLAGQVLEILPQLHEHYDEWFRRYVLQRMYVSGLNTALQDTLREEGSFTLLLPNVYTWSREDEKTFRFLNANRNQGALDRSILVSWREGTEVPTAEELVAWRDAISETIYEWGVRTDTEQVRSRTPDGFAEGSTELQGVWVGTDPTFPMAGPFLTRAVVCPELDRTYLLDAWLYAPSRDKYEYVLQLQTILDSFERAHV